MQCFILFCQIIENKMLFFTTSHSKRLIELLKKQKQLTSELSTISENTDGCA